MQWILLTAVLAGSGAGAFAQHGDHASHEPQHAQHSPESHAVDDSAMTGFYGLYPMSREGSGTAWQPEAAPMQMRHFRRDAWDVMYMGFANAVYADAFAQGPLEADFRFNGRGEEDFFVESMGMVAARRAALGGTLTLRTMVSLDPALVGDDGYPLLLQTGETSDGITLIDYQHPHDLISELAVSFSRALEKEGRSAFVYAGLPGEPALGPVAFMHRASGMDNPDAPITHHWLDSTHITVGVLTGGVVLNNVKLDASVFSGREPDEDRYDIDTGSPDSWSARVSWNPSPSWSMQLSYAALNEPELHENPPVDIDRTTASVTYHRALAMGYWQSTLALGRNDKAIGRDTDAFLVESALRFRDVTTVFLRVESAGKDELFRDVSALHHTEFRVRKVGVGFVRDLHALWKGRFGVGAVYNRHSVSDIVELFYDGDPDSWLVFARWRI